MSASIPNFSEMMLLQSSSGVNIPTTHCLTVDSERLVSFAMFLINSWAGVSFLFSMLYKSMNDILSIALLIFNVYILFCEYMFIKFVAKNILVCTTMFLLTVAKLDIKSK